MRQANQDDEDDQQQGDKVGKSAAHDIAAQNDLQADDHEQHRPERGHGGPNLPRDDAEIVEDENNADKQHNDAAKAAAATATAIEAAARTAPGAGRMDGAFRFRAANLFAKDGNVRFRCFIFGVVIFHSSILYQKIAEIIKVIEPPLWKRGAAGVLSEMSKKYGTKPSETELTPPSLFQREGSKKASI